MANQAEITHLFRVENPNIINPPDGVIWHEQLRGQWFFDDMKNTQGYLRQITNTRYPNWDVVDGARLVIAHVPADIADQFRASNHPIAAKLHHSNGDFIIPRNGSVPTDEFGIDWLMPRLRYKFDSKNVQKAQRRIELLSKVALISWGFKSENSPNS